MEPETSTEPEMPAEPEIQVGPGKPQPSRMTFLGLTASASSFTLGTLAGSILALVGAALPGSQGGAQLAFGGLGLAGLAFGFVLIRLAGRSSTRATVAILVLGLLSAAGGGAGWALRPRPSPIHPVEVAALLLAGCAVATLACAAALVSALRPARLGPPMRWATKLGALALAVGLTVGLGWAVLLADTAYLIVANSYTELYDTAAATEPVGSTLSGQLAWRQNGFLDQYTEGPLSLTTDGIPLVSGTDVIMVEPNTGRIRWRFFRSDLTYGSPSVSATDDGTAVLVDWTTDHAGYLVLDAATGQPVSSWPQAYADAELLAAPSVGGALLRIPGPHSSESVDRVDTSGRRQWTFTPGRGCRTPNAAVSAGVAVIAVDAGSGCGDDRVVGLDQDTGVARWSRSGAFYPITTTGDLVIAGDSTDFVKTLTALDAKTGRIVWTHPLVATGATLDCRRASVAAASSVVQADCFVQTASTSDEQSSPRAIFRFEAGSGQQTVIRPTRVADVDLSADGRTLLLLRTSTSRLDPVRALQIFPGGSTRTLAGLQDNRSSTSNAGLSVAGNQVLISLGPDRFLALR